jgi:HEAT repeat protein
MLSRRQAGEHALHDVGEHGAPAISVTPSAVRGVRHSPLHPSAADSGIIIVMRSRTAIAGLLFIVLVCLPARRSGADDEGPLRDADYEPTVIERLIETLRTGDADARYRAGYALQLRGPEARAAISEMFSVRTDHEGRDPYGMAPLSFHADQWLEQIGREVITAADEALASEDESLRITALKLLARYGFESAAALPRVQARFAVADEDEAPHVVGALAALDETGEVAIPFLQQALEHDDESVRNAAVAVLDATPPEPGTLRIDRPGWQPPVVRWSEHQPRFREQAIALLLQALEDPAPEVRGTAASVLGSYPDAHERVLPALLRHLDDDEQFSVMISNHLRSWETVRDRVFEALANFSDQADDLLPKLIDSFVDQEFDLFHRQERALVALAPHAETAVARFSDLLATERWELAIQPLGAIGPAARTALPRLEQRLAGAEKYQQMRIAAAIYNIKPQHEEAGAMIRQWLATEETDPLGPLFEDLAPMGPRAAPLVPLLLPHLREHEYAWLDPWVAHLLQAIGPEAAPAIPILIDELGEWLSGKRSQQTLWRIGTATVPPLIDVLRDEAAEPEKVVDALKVIGMLGKDAAAAFDDVVRLIGSQYPNVREAAATALATIGEHTQTVPVLLRALDDPRPLVRRAAVLSLARFPEPDESTIAALSQRLNDEFLDVQFAVCQTLGDFGADAGSATGALEAYRDVGNAHQQHVARRALRRMQGE